MINSVTYFKLGRIGAVSRVAKPTKDSENQHHIRLRPHQ